VLYYLLAALGYTLAALPEGLLAAGCRGLGWLVATLPSRRRHTLRSNLSHAFPEQTEAWRRQIALECVRRSLEMVLFLLASPYFSKERLQRQFTVHEDLERMIREYTANPGSVVILSPHFSLMEGNSMLPMLVPGAFPPIGALYRPLDSPGMEKWVKQTREQWGLRLMSRREGYYQAVDMLRQQGAVVMLFDQNAGSTGALTLFMGRVCSTTELAGLLVEKCKTRVAFIYPERRGFMRAAIHGEYFGVAMNTEAVTFAGNLWLENKLSSSDNFCADWLWLHARWRHQDEPRQRFRLHNKRNLLAEQMASLGLTALPRRTRYFFRMPNWLGDVVMALPLLRAVRLGRPDAEITLLAQPAFIPLLEKLQIADRYLTIPPRGKGYGKFFALLRLKYVDVHVLFTNSLLGDQEAWLAGAPQRFGMKRPGKWRPWLTHTWDVPADLDETKIHQTRVWEKFFQHFGLKEELDLRPIKWPGIIPASKENPVIGLICGTENFPEKRWPVEKWRELIKAILVTRPKAVISLFGTARDAEITNAVAKEFPPERVRNLAGKTNLIEFAEALAGCTVIVCNDTGGMHLANLLGVPVVVVYGPTNPVRTGPIFDAPRAILQPPGCPPTGGAALADLPAAQVFEAVKNWLG
jgi:ADP-heptose:LPS heptosyltransferase/lauroyl/myristoyl acyltransferase